MTDLRELPLPVLPDTPDPLWRHRAACDGMDVEEFFTRVTSEAYAACASCPVRGDCLLDTMLVESSMPRGAKREGMVGGIQVQRRHALAVELGMFGC